ncbi:TrfA family protein [Caldimonas thermodepolymerans]|uniref:plasmid replication initiator TrfA n=1 Tax=Caldimonas thermodepolymerans TaxID=215580 RepID=UPI00189290A6|nr:plasmid replication initiator TrfA [Caldimonas thermodepolymerans]QPC31689.1 TrfA family protein [Caldimonas thermodepolymerans]
MQSRCAKPGKRPAVATWCNAGLGPETVRAVPNGFLRSALFGAIAKGRRRYINGEDLAAVDGVTIRYKGERLDQGDLDVWESVLHAVRLQELGSRCRVTSYALLKLMGKTDTGKNRATLQTRIERLVANAVTVKQGRYTYIGGLIRFAAKDEETQEWVIELDEKLRPLFAADQFTQVEWAVRHALDGHQLAQWLHGFYASHAKPFPIKIETLHRLCGSPLRGGLPTPARTGKVRGTNVAPICMKFSTVQTSSQCLETQAGRGFTPDRAAGVRETAVGVMQQFCSL